MSKVVKSRAVVSAHNLETVSPETQAGMITSLPEGVIKRGLSASPETQTQTTMLAPLPEGVIKRGFSAQPRREISTDFRLLGPRDPYVEELNRLKVEIEQARSELRRLRVGISDELIAIDNRAGEDESGEEPGNEMERETSSERELAAARDEARRMSDQAEKAAREMESKAYGLLRDAEENAKTIEAKALFEAQQLKEQAENQGYLEGFNKGFEEAQAEFRKENEPRAELLADLIENLSEFEQRRLKENEHELIELALGVASKVIWQELKTDSQTIVKMLTDTVMQNHSEEYVRITLADDLFPLKAKISDKVKQMLTGMGANVSVMVDSSASSGTVQVETPKGITDMSVDTQLDNIRDILEAR